MSETSARRFKDTIYEQFARIGKAIASPRRLELLDLLSQGPRTVDALARQAAQSLANTSQHLQVLRGARLVEADKDGLYVTYQLLDSEVASFLQAIRQLAESRLAEIEQTKRVFLERRGLMEPVDREALLKRVRSGKVTVLDVRPPEEFRAGHIPGALSVPLAELKKRLAGLPKDRDVVAYCRGPYCVMAIEAVALLQEKGFRAYRMEQGVVEWRASGGRIETSRERART